MQIHKFHHDNHNTVLCILVLICTFVSHPSFAGNNEAMLQVQHRDFCFHLVWPLTSTTVLASPRVPLLLVRCIRNRTEITWGQQTDARILLHLSDVEPLLRKHSKLQQFRRFMWDQTFISAWYWCSGEWPLISDYCRVLFELMIINFSLS